MKQSPILNFIPYIALVTGCFLWASSFIALKLAFAVYDPMVVIFGRMLVATLCFLPFMKQFDLSKARKGDWKLLLFMAFCEPCLYFGFEAQALVNTSASQAGMICSMLPLLVAIAAWFTLKEKISQRTILGFIIAMTGACTLSLLAESTDSAPNPIFGNFMEFMAMVCATGYMVTLKSLCTRYSPWFLTAIQAFVGAVFFFPVLFFPQTVLPTTFDPIGMGSIFYLGACITIGAYGLYNYGTSKIPVTMATAFINLLPVFTLFLGWLILNERLSPLEYGACSLVLVGVFVSQDFKKKA
ncbi:MAG: DMT family transporter [Desulfovibrio sp.]